ALALAPLVGLDHLARRMLALGELDRGVGERAAAARRFGREFGHLAKKKAKLGVGVAGMRGARRLPHGFALGRELLEVCRDQLVARAEMPVERHLVRAGGRRGRVHAYRVDAVVVEKLARRLQDPLPRRRLRRWSFQTRHAALRLTTDVTDQYHPCYYLVTFRSKPHPWSR